MTANLNDASPFQKVVKMDEILIGFPRTSSNLASPDFLSPVKIDS